MLGQKTEKTAMEYMYLYAGDVVCSHYLKREMQYRQHGSVSCYEHSVAVTRISVALALKFRAKVDMESLIKGALLHDYFLYDWHVEDTTRRGHGFYHPKLALANAQRDFALTPVACDVIEKHMFPLTPQLPKYKESYIVTIADKLCATKEVAVFVKIKLCGSAKKSVLFFRKWRQLTT